MKSKKKKVLLAILIVISSFLIFMLSVIIYAAYDAQFTNSGCCHRIYLLTDEELVPLIEQSITGDSNATQRIAAYYTECTSKTNIAKYWRTVLSSQNPEDTFLIQYNKRMDNYYKALIEFVEKPAEKGSFDREESSELDLK